MKKIIFLLCVSFFMGNAFAIDSESDIKESSTIESVSKMTVAIRKCCRRTVRNAEGESWTARRCVTHEDGYIAMGRACQLALADAQRAQELAYSYTLIKD
jgi:hypothetical protein